LVEIVHWDKIKAEGFLHKRAEGVSCSRPRPEAK